MYAKMVAIFSVISHILFLIIYCLIMGQEPFSNQNLLKWIEIGIIALVLLIVAIPEGLPVAVSLAMALSTDQLKKEQILIKNIESVQTCAMLHEICVGKTGCLTTGEMKLKMYQLSNKEDFYDAFVEEFNSCHLADTKDIS